MWPDELLLILVSFSLATVGATYTQMRGRKDYTLGLSSLITSLILLYFGIAKLEGEIILNWDQYLKMTFYIGSLFLWLIFFVIGRLEWSRRMLQGPIQVVIIMFFIFWLIVRDGTYTWQDAFLYFALTFWIGVNIFRRKTSSFI